MGACQQTQAKQASQPCTPSRQPAFLASQPASQLCHASLPYWAAWARHDGQPDSPIQPASHASQPTRTAALNISHTRQAQVSWAALRSTNQEPLRAHDARPKAGNQKTMFPHTELVGEISSSREGAHVRSAPPRNLCDKDNLWAVPPLVPPFLFGGAASGG